MAAGVPRRTQRSHLPPGVVPPTMQGRRRPGQGPVPETEITLNPHYPSVEKLCSNGTAFSKKNKGGKTQPENFAGKWPLRLRASPHSEMYRVRRNRDAAAAESGGLPAHRGPARDQVAQRGPGRPLDLAQRRALRVHAGARRRSKSLAPDSISRRAAVFLPRLWQPRRVLADAGAAGQARHQVLRLPEHGRPGALPRDRRGHGAAGLRLHEPRHLQHPLPLYLRRGPGAGVLPRHHRHPAPPHRQAAEGHAGARHLGQRQDPGPDGRGRAHLPHRLDARRPAGPHQGQPAASWCRCPTPSS